MIGNGPTVEEAVHSYLTDLKDLLVRLTGEHLSCSYELDDEDWSEKINSANYTTRNFATLHALQYAYLTQFYAQVFGSRVSSQTNFLDTENALKFTVTQAEGTQFGGGLGNGFQLYCDKRVLITTGGGGGGGAFTSRGSLTLLSVGSGGGAGVQLSTNFGMQSWHDRKLDTFSSFGGGGGCGTCTPHDSQSMNTTNILCGTSVDKSSLSLSALRTLLATEYTPEAFATNCKRITVTGGGGGGGGIMFPTGETVGAGYGFKFIMTNYMPHNTVTATPTREVSLVEDQATFRPTRDLHVSFSRLMNESVGACGGYAQWGCICNQMRHTMQACSEGGGATLECGALQSVNDTVLAMLAGSCASVLPAGAPGSNSCPVERTLAYHQDYRTTSNTTLQVDYFVRTSEAEAAPSQADRNFAWVLAGATEIQQRMAQVAQTRTSNEQTFLLRAEGPLAARVNKHEGVAAVVAVLLLLFFVCVCRSLIHELLDRWRHRSYFELH